MTATHSKSELMDYFNRVNTGVLATLDAESGFIRQRVMYYGVDSNFHCYLMSTKESPKVPQILSTGNLSLLIYGLEVPYDDSWEIELNGPARLIDSEKEIQSALKALQDRNPFADVALESGIHRQFDFILLTPKLVRFRIYREALSGDAVSVFNLEP